MAVTVWLAVLPLLVVIGALLARRSTLSAAAWGLSAAVLVAAAAFDLSWELAAELAGEWWSLVVEVMVIIGGGVAFAEAGRRMGDQARLSEWLRRCLGSGVAPALAVVHGVTPLAESLTGFGVGVAIAVPLLLGLGYAGHKAAPIGLLGLCAVPWGSMGPGTLIAAELSGTGFRELGVMSALFSLPVFLGAGVAAALIAAERGERARAVGLAVASGLVLWVSVAAANLVFGTAPAGAVGAAVTLAVHLLAHRLRGGRRLALSAAELRALAPYGLLLGGVLAASVTVRALGLEGTGWRVLASPAPWLVLTALFTLRSRLGEVAPTVSHTVRTWAHVGPATALFILLGAVMSESGMSDQIAVALAGLGGAYLFFVPVLGGVGGFITGSNSGANAMFAGPQTQAAEVLGASVLPATAAQNVSASLLTMTSPARIELAVRLCPDPPARRPVFAWTLGTAVPVTLALSVLTVAVAGWAG